MSNDLPASADCVVIGGGVIGCSIAFHLAQAGAGNVVLLERGQLGCGTSWHSAANIALVDASVRAYVEFYRYNRHMFAFLEEDTGQAVGWRETGRLQIAANEARWLALRHIADVAEANGIDADMIDAAEVGRLLPMLRTDDLLGALWTPNAGRVNVTDLIAAYAKAARKRGATILEGTSVTGIEVKDDRIAAVTTTRGRIATARVVNAAGLWAPQIAALVDLRLPIHANEHFYILTKGFEGIRSDMPAFRDADAAIYAREEVGGLLLGCFERRAKPIALESLPRDFSFGLLPENWDQFEPYMEAALHRIPALQNAEVKMLLNGPEGFTPDGKFLLGAMPRIDGLYVLAGMNSAGVNNAAGSARALAEQVVGAPTWIDVSAFDPARFTRFSSSPEWLAERVAEAPGHLYTLGRVARDFETGRRLRRSPLHELLEARGARFASVTGWERPVLTVRDGETESDAYRREWEALQGSVGLHDATAAGRFFVSLAVLAGMLPGIGIGDLRPGRCRAVLVPGPGGGGRSRIVIAPIDAETALVTVDAMHEGSMASLFLGSARAGIDPSALATSGLVQLVVGGPRASEVVEPYCSSENRLDIAGGEGVAVYLPDAEQWLLTIHAEFAGWAFEHLEGRVTELGGCLIGHRALELARILRGVPAVGREVVPGIPVDALTRKPGEGGPQLVLAWSEAPVATGDPLWSGDRPAGYVTSAASLPQAETAIIGFTNTATNELEVVADGKRLPLRRRSAGIPA